MHYKDYDINIRINIKSWLLGAYSLRKLQEFTYLASEFGMHPITKNYFEYGKAFRYSRLESPHGQRSPVGYSP